MFILEHRWDGEANFLQPMAITNAIWIENYQSIVNTKIPTKWCDRLSEIQLGVGIDLNNFDMSFDEN